MLFTTSLFDLVQAKPSPGTEYRGCSLSTSDQVAISYYRARSSYFLPSTNSTRFSRPPPKMCIFYEETCSSCRRIIYRLDAQPCFERNQTICIEPTMQRRVTRNRCHFCNLTLWRSLNYRCELLHAMKCRSCGRTSDALVEYYRTVSDIRNCWSINPRRLDRYLLLSRILQGELVLHWKTRTAPGFFPDDNNRWGVR